MSKQFKVQTIGQLRDEMVAVSRGERRPPKGAGSVSFESADAITRLLTPSNRALLATIEATKPKSINALAKQVRRAAPNLYRTLIKLEAAGLVKLVRVSAYRVYPVVAVRRVRIDIDPLSNAQDKVRLTPKGRQLGRAPAAVRVAAKSR